ncbi:MAG: methyltransferase regulatory domain-containing protein [Alphaproteobacteria bacterium]|nr:methyltransferase regulatory domain-containing protein [Alphaproteobacteria bacterium]
MSGKPDAGYAEESLKKSYDQLPYETRARRKTHPDTLATLATIFGLPAPPIARARILEIGCGPGENLLAIAHALPDASCVGIDFSAPQIAQANALAESIDTKNAQFICCDFNELSGSFDSFDYVIAHGVLSWIPPERHGELIATCSQCLGSGGLLFLSYNTLPGWHQRQVVRDFLLRETTDIADIGAKVRHAREALSSLAARVGSMNWTYGHIIQDECDNVAKLGDSYLAHDLLETFNSAFYFADILRRTAEQDLHYVAEAAFEAMVPDTYPQAIADAMRATANLEQREQDLDFLINRSFRESIFVKTLRPSAQPDQRSLTKLLVASSLQRLPDRADKPGTAVYRSPGGTEISVNPGAAQTALDGLATHYPEPRSLEEIVGPIQQARHAALEPNEILALINTLFAAFSRGLISLHSARPRIRAHPGPHPIASALARNQSIGGTRVTTMLLDNIELDDSDCRAILRLLDGRHDLPAMVRALPPEPTVDPMARVTVALAKLARAGLIVDLPVE